MIGRRIAAGLIDVLALGVLFVLFAILLGDTSTEDGTARANLTGGPFVLYMLAWLLYYFAPEVLTGRTLGKALLGLRVVRADGGRAGAGPIAGRTALRLVDVLPAFYLVGFIVMLATGERRQRVGDLAASTRVVRA